MRFRPIKVKLLKQCDEFGVVVFFSHRDYCAAVKISTVVQF